MPNFIKYSASAQTLALKKGNFWIGTGDVSKGPTSSTDYWNGIAPPTGGYTIYLNKASNGPSIFRPQNDSELISLTNNIAGTAYTTASECLTYFAGQSDKMCFNREYEGIVTNGLVMNLDSGFSPSYPTTGTTWYDTSPSVNTGTLINGPTYSSNDGGSLVFDGSDDYVTVQDSASLNFTSAMTVDFWTYIIQPISGGSMFIHQQSGATYGGFEIYRNDSGGVLFNKNGNINLVISASNYFPLNVWRNVVCTSDGSTARIYINGSNVASAAGSLPDNVNGIIRIGNWVNPGSYQVYGRIPIMRMYNIALSSAEVLQNYNAQKSRFGL
jgi:hypothetical protein